MEVLITIWKEWYKVSSWRDSSNTAVAALKNDFKSGRVIPFVGSGLSISSHLPSWRSLLEALATDLGFEPDVFVAQGSFPQLFDYYFAVSRPETREAYAAKLNREFARATANFVPSRVHHALVNLRPRVVYTTNYDDLLERSFQEAGLRTRVISSYLDIAAGPGDEEVQVVKFHGDFTSHKSLVMSESQYFDRMSLDSAIDIRLRAEALGKSLLFMGYSLNDVNVRYLLYRLNKERNEKVYDDGRRVGPKSYLASFGMGEVQRTILSVRFNVETIELLPDDPEAAMAELLESCARP